MNYLLASRAKRAFALTAVACAGLLAPTAAQADVTLTSAYGGPVAPFNNANTGMALDLDGPGADGNDLGCFPGVAPTLSTQAGVNTDYCVSFTLAANDPDTGDDAKDTLVQLPVGTLGEIDKAAKCSLAEFNAASPSANTCPAASQVGTLIAQFAVGAPANSTATARAACLPLRRRPTRRPSWALPSAAARRCSPSTPLP